MFPISFSCITWPEESFLLSLYQHIPHKRQNQVFVMNQWGFQEKLLLTFSYAHTSSIGLNWQWYGGSLITVWPASFGEENVPAKWFENDDGHRQQRVGNIYHIFTLIIACTHCIICIISGKCHVSALFTIRSIEHGVNLACLYLVSLLVSNLVTCIISMKCSPFNILILTFAISSILYFFTGACRLLNVSNSALFSSPLRDTSESR